MGKYYDLWYGYCNYIFLEKCRFSMACARCNYSLPKSSSQAQFLEGKANLLRMQQEMPLTEEERATLKMELSPLRNCSRNLKWSIVRGEATATSDLDLVIVTKEVTVPYRESLYVYGWPTEVFVNTPTSYREFFASNIQRRRPSLPRMCAEGIIVRDHEGVAQHLKQEASNLLEQGPPPLSKEEITQLRYAVTDLLDDFIGSVRTGESFFIASGLAERSSELMLSYHGQWIGKGKWVLRALHAFDPQLAQRLTAALESFCQQGKKDGLITFAQEALDLVGGRLFEGYSSGKKVREAH